MGFLIGDAIAQLLTRDHKYDGLRTLRFAAIGFFLHAPVADAWFTLLEAVGPPSSVLLTALIATVHGTGKC